MMKVAMAVVLAAFLPALASAQAVLKGRVVDSEMGQPLPGARISIGNDTTTRAISDDSGYFQLANLPRGNLELHIRLIGYEEGITRTFIPESGSVGKLFALDFNGFLLPEIVVQARAEVLQSRYIDFERRRMRKIGAYFRWDDIKKQGYNTVGDALRTVRGVRIQCDQARFECNAVMARTPNCHPTWYIDGIEVHSFRENTPIRDIYGIEVYRGTGEIPGEYAGSNAGCGVIVVWTKSKPYR